MSKAVLISIRPKWCQKIISGEKTIEVRKTSPRLKLPFQCYIYCTNSGVACGMWGMHGKVIGEFVCDKIVDAREDAISAILGELPDAHYPEWYASVLTELPAADVAEVVHCRDCKHKVRTDANGIVICSERHGMIRPTENDFCSHGEYQTNMGGNGNAAD